MRPQLTRSFKILACLALLLPCFTLKAQFSSSGEEPASVRWNQVKTRDYRVIYPRGLDSLARCYATLLEQVKMPVGADVGRYPNQFYRRRMPVVLRPYNVLSNGMVAWAPRRMELYTTPDFQDPLPMPWDRHLVIHESRHVAQMQYVNEGPFRPFNWIVGQMFSGLASTVYCGPSFFEGDAVLAETELTESGRGRSADFLEYMRMSFLNGDRRDWWQWRYGSLDRYTPDYYHAGYLRMAGIRTLYNAPGLTERYYDRIFAKRCWPWPLFNWNKTVKELGGKGFKAAFAEVCDSLAAEWQVNDSQRLAAAGRSLYTDAVPVLAARARTAAYDEYTSITTLGDGKLYALRSGIDRTLELVRVDTTGLVERIQGFASYTSQVKADSVSGRLWWSEIRTDPRWSMRSWSELRCTDSLGLGKHTLRRGTRWFNPSPSPDGKLLAAVETAVEGTTSVVIVDSGNGEVVESIKAPAGMQLLETAWLDGKLFVSGVTGRGCGIYCASEGFRNVLDAQPRSIKQLFSHKGLLWFTSDRSGVNELHSLDPCSGELRQRSISRNGAQDFHFCADGSTLYYASLESSGRLPFKMPADSLVNIAISDSDRYEQKTARELSSTSKGSINYDQPVEISAPEKYVKAAHLLRFHSWAPVYLDYDNVNTSSLENLSTTAGLGATAFFQNDLSTASGYLAWNTSWSQASGWYNMLMGKMTYRGWYPVVELSMSISNDHPGNYFLLKQVKENRRYTTLVSQKFKELPLFQAHIKTYLPLHFNSGGWQRGVIPQMEANLTNSIITYGKSVPMNRVSASVRGYIMKPVAKSCVYPRWGLGMEAGVNGRIGASSLFSPNVYAYAYGYIPGVLRTHGIKLTGIVQQHTGKALFMENYASVLPRGFAAAGIATNLSSYTTQARVTADYVLPFAPVSWSGLGNIAYLRNFELTLKGDAGSYSTSTKHLNLASAGADFAAVLGNFFWIPFTTRLGVQFYYNFGQEASQRCYLGMLFTMDI